ncbi:LITAF-like zinc ribbon domain-containing protein [Allofrancisella frigidaquae]|uniref:Uncharacterized protein n=1 Tax=Allofrancisella frigidaquae TaxID=1085644 RepID=A0A6M3HT17_9GAMM|nr:LITAF-like zinc ribbon domain-containing protein [Allofrancisella frigidaquae]QIV94305.1 hypothetical protein E3E15_02615 [Allofrancisella frigidaquae]
MSLKSRAISFFILILTASSIVTLFIKLMGLSFTKENLGNLLTAVSITSGFNLRAVMNISSSKNLKNQPGFKTLEFFITISNLATYITFLSYIGLTLASDRVFKIVSTNTYASFLLCFFTILSIAFIPFLIIIIKDY